MPVLTAAGLVAPRASDFLTSVRQAFADRTGLEVDWDRDLVLGQLTAILAVELGTLAEGLQAIYDGLSLNNAAGVQLDELGKLVGVARLEATASRAAVVLGGVGGTPVPAGSLVQGGGTDGRARWRTVADAVVGANVEVECVVDGAISAGVGQIATIVTPVAGWTTVTNGAAAVPGRDRETDAAYRQRRQESLELVGARSLAALRAELLTVDGVQAAVVVDNDGATSATVEGVALDPHSIGVVLWPSTLTPTQEEAVARAIYDHLPPGIKSNGAQTATVIGEDGLLKTVRWAYASQVTVNVAVVVTLAAGYAVGDVSAAVGDAVDAYFDGLRVGDEVRMLGLLVRIGQVAGVVGATLTLNGGSVDITVSAAQIGVRGTLAVT